MVNISKKDWKLFMERVGDWQEHYMEGLVREYIDLLQSPGHASEHFWELEGRIKKDKKHPGVMIGLRKSEAMWDIARFIKLKVITYDDLKDFSPELIEGVKMILSRQTELY